MAINEEMGLAAPQGMMGDPMQAPQGDPAAMADPSQGAMPGAQPAPGGQIDVAQIEAGVKVPDNLKPAFGRIILSGMRIMFGKESHQLLVDQLKQPGTLTENITKGIISLMYLLWTQSNKTIPPQLMVPATVVLTCRAFDYLQKTGNPDATKEVFGDALADSVDGVMQRFGVDTNNLQGALQQGAQQGAAAEPQQGLAAPAAPMAAPGGAPQAGPGGPGIMGMGG